MPAILHKHHLVCVLSINSQTDAIAYCIWKLSVYYTSIHSQICWSLLLGGNITKYLKNGKVEYYAILLSCGLGTLVSDVFSSF